MIPMPTFNGMNHPPGGCPSSIDSTYVAGVQQYTDIMYKLNLGEAVGNIIEEKMAPVYARLAILENVDHAKLEKFAALKKAYEHYKLLEKMLDDDSK